MWRVINSKIVECDYYKDFLGFVPNYSKMNFEGEELYISLICPYCKKEFEQKHKHQKYCSYECGKRYNNIKKKKQTKIIV